MTEDTTFLTLVEQYKPDKDVVEEVSRKAEK